MNEAGGWVGRGRALPRGGDLSWKAFGRRGHLHFKGPVSLSFLRPSAVVGMSLAWSEDVEYRARGGNAACHRDSRTHRSPRELMLRSEIRMSRRFEVLRKHVGGRTATSVPLWGLVTVT